MPLEQHADAWARDPYPPTVLMPASTPRLPPKILCPRCGEVTAWAGNPYRPFCSERCKLIDLGAWASEDYKIPGKPLSPEEALDAMQQQREQERAAEQEGKKGEE